VPVIVRHLLVLSVLQVGSRRRRCSLDGGRDRIESGACRGFWANCRPRPFAIPCTFRRHSRNDSVLLSGRHVHDRP